MCSSDLMIRRPPRSTLVSTLFPTRRSSDLADGRVISVPLAWSWRLSDATPDQRSHWELIGDGGGVHWPDVDEDLSAEGMLHGVPARRPKPAKT